MVRDAALGAKEEEPVIRPEPLTCPAVDSAPQNSPPGGSAGQCQQPSRAPDSPSEGANTSPAVATEQVALLATAHLVIAAS